MSSITDVQNERRKLHRLKRANEAHLCEDWEDVKWELRPQNLMEQAVGRMACGLPAFGRVYAGIQTAIALLRKRQSADGERDCGC